GGVTAVDYGPRRPAVPVYPISRRQREALLWIARGHTDDEPEQDLDTAVRFHQQRTVDNLIELRTLAPDIPWMPVLQG
ncbi:hypothetical protein KBZ21_44550, partial [Streptomyces sp. A73]|nr:hypothetical protein [Streptomyces sp. A73]